jgi:hypothetical protein
MNGFRNFVINSCLLISQFPGFDNVFLQVSSLFFKETAMVQYVVNLVVSLTVRGGPVCL